MITRIKRWLRRRLLRKQIDSLFEFRCMAFEQTKIALENDHHTFGPDWLYWMRQFNGALANENRLRKELKNT